MLFTTLKYFSVYLFFYKYPVLPIHVVTTLHNLLSSLLLVKSAAGVPPCVLQIGDFKAAHRLLYTVDTVARAAS